MKRYLEKEYVDRLKSGEDGVILFAYKDHSQYSHNYEVTIKIKKIDKTPLRQKIKKKWNAFVRLFIL